MPGGTVTLNPEHGSSLTLLLNAAPDKSGGIGGWQPVERARRQTAKWWQGLPDETISLDCTLDQDAVTGPDLERRIVVLRTMGKPRDDTDGEPPTIQLSGDVQGYDAAVTWVMTDLTWGDRLFNSDGSLRRQQVTIALEHFIDISEIKPIRVKPTRKGGKRRRHTAVTKTGDTLRTVALRELGNAGRWKDLRSWNAKLKKVDPDQRLRSGTHVTVK
jgi:hypothetical protein